MSSRIVCSPAIVAIGTVLIGSACGETPKVSPCEDRDVVAQLAALCPNHTTPSFDASGQGACELEVGLSDEVSLESIGGVCRKSGECTVFCSSACPSGEVATYVDENRLICGSAECIPGEAYCVRREAGPVRVICQADGKEFNEFQCAADEICVKQGGVEQCALPCPDAELMYRDDDGICRCADGLVFDAATRRCVACAPACGGRECGDDPLCGQSCGVCDTGFSCLAGTCEECTCGEQECGQGPCELFCGDCASGEECQGGRCVANDVVGPPLASICCTGVGYCATVEPAPVDAPCSCELYGYIFDGVMCI